MRCIRARLDGGRNGLFNFDAIRLTHLVLAQFSPSIRSGSADDYEFERCLEIVCLLKDLQEKGHPLERVFVHIGILGQQPVA